MKKIIPLFAILPLIGACWHDPGKQVYLFDKAYNGVLVSHDREHSRISIELTKKSYFTFRSLHTGSKVILLNSSLISFSDSFGENMVFGEGLTYTFNSIKEKRYVFINYTEEANVRVGSTILNIYDLDFTDGYN